MWFRVDDKLWGSPKWVSIKPGARALWVTAGSWSMDQLTDGFVPDHVLPILGAKPADARALLDAELWEKVDGGYKFHDWADYQPSRQTVLDKRDAEAARKAEWRAKRAAVRNKSTTSPTDVPDVSRRDNNVSPAPVPDVSRSSRPDPTRPDPTAPKGAPSLSPPSRKKPATTMPTGWAPNEKHRDLAQTLGLNLDNCVRDFTDHAETNDRRCASWDAAFRTWLNKAAEYANRNRPTQRTSTTDQRYAQGMAVVARLEDNGRRELTA